MPISNTKLTALVAKYQSNERCNNLDCFERKKTGVLGESIRKAAMAETDSGRHPHQRRISGSALKDFAEKLKKKEDKILFATSFAEIHEIVESCRIKGIGPLTIYDTALRISVSLKPRRLPKKVWLHAGTKIGAKRLGVKILRGEKNLPVDRFPASLRILKPHEIEDFLCRAKKCFA